MLEGNLAYAKKKKNKIDHDAVNIQRHCKVFKIDSNNNDNNYNNMYVLPVLLSPSLLCLSKKFHSSKYSY